MLRTNTPRLDAEGNPELVEGMEYVDPWGQRCWIEGGILHWERILGEVDCLYSEKSSQHTLKMNVNSGAHSFKYPQESGFQKQDEGKPDPLVIPPDLLLQVVEVMTEGARTYGYENHKKPGVQDRFLSAAHRHLIYYRMGQETPNDSDHHHLIHAIADLFLHLDSKK